MSISFYLNIFFNRFCPVKNFGATPHCLYRDFLTLNVQLDSECASVKKKE